MNTVVSLLDTEHTALVAALWEELERWTAHITLAQWDISAANLPAILPAILQRLVTRPLAWRITVASLALIAGAGAGTEATYALHGRYALTGSA